MERLHGDRLKAAVWNGQTFSGAPVIVSCDSPLFAVAVDVGGSGGHGVVG